MRYLDSNVFIYLALAPKTEPKAIASAKLMEDIVDGRIGAATSSLAWDEMVWVIKKKEGVKIAQSAGKKFLAIPRLKILDIDESVLTTAQAVMEQYDLDPRDSIHLACCINNSIEEIISDDTDFDSAKNIIKRVGI